MKIIVDTNIVFSALLKNENHFRRILLSKNHSFHTCRFLFVEIFKQKEKIIRFSAMNEEDILTSLHQILKNIEFHNEDLISKDNWRKAYELCKNADLKDMPLIALTLEIGGLFWTGDKRMKKVLISKGVGKLFFDIPLLLNN